MTNWSHFALCVVCLFIITGVGFLSRPTRGPLLWVLAVATATIGSAITTISPEEPRSLLTQIGELVMVSASFLVWSGLRADRGMRSLWWACPALIVLGTFTGLVVAAVVPTAVKLIPAVGFVLSGLIGLLIVTELVRRVPRDMPAQLPLLVVSALGLPMAGLLLVSRLIEDPDGAGIVARVPIFVSVYVACYLVCALVTLLCLTRQRRDPGRGADDPLETALTAVQRRLDRARLRNEIGWCLVVVGLDSADLFRTSLGAGADVVAMEHVRACADRSFPADADVLPVASDHFVIVASAPDHVTRERVRQLLADVGASVVLAGVTVSASAGWARTEEVGFDARALYAQARAALVRAQNAGGDSWERASAVR